MNDQQIKLAVSKWRTPASLGLILNRGSAYPRQVHPATRLRSLAEATKKINGPDAQLTGLHKLYDRLPWQEALSGRLSPGRYQNVLGPQGTGLYDRLLSLLDKLQGKTQTVIKPSPPRKVYDNIFRGLDLAAESRNRTGREIVTSINPKSGPLADGRVVYGTPRLGVATGYASNLPGKTTNDKIGPIAIFEPGARQRYYGHTGIGSAQVAANKRKLHRADWRGNAAPGRAGTRTLAANNSSVWGETNDYETNVARNKLKSLGLFRYDHASSVPGGGLLFAPVSNKIMEDLTGLPVGSRPLRPHMMPSKPVVKKRTPFADM